MLWDPFVPDALFSKNFYSLHHHDRYAGMCKFTIVASPEGKSLAKFQGQTLTELCNKLGTPMLCSMWAAGVRMCPAAAELLPSRAKFDRF